MPGEASLRAGQYYAHPQNAFWRVMGAICGAGPELDYPARTRRLLASGIAVWDVLQQCVRRGSLDAAIERDTLVPNDFVALFARRPGLRMVVCNGATAFSCWRRYVAPQLEAAGRAVPVVQLPSTSPAHASLRIEEKMHRWRAAVSPWLGP